MTCQPSILQKINSRNDAQGAGDITIKSWSVCGLSMMGKERCEMSKDGSKQE